jgi:hydroxymethylglutaryl-CoA synthase
MDSEVVTVAADHGDLGAASALAALARAFENEAETALAVGFGSGACADALLFDGAAPVVSNADRETKTVDYANYLRLRGELDTTPPAGGGAQVSVPSWRRQRRARYRLAAGRCPNCSAIAFPAEGACPDCLELVTYDDVQLSHTGTVETVTGVSPGGAPPEFAAQAERGGDFGVAIVSFPTVDGDGNASAPVQLTDANVGRVDSGDAVDTVVRRIYTQEGVTRYGRKGTPAE